jgi:alpha-galactosidase/6-phospho-beta-glucosidase family protein
LADMKIDKTIKIAFVGGGSQNWAPTLIRDIVFHRGMDHARLDIRLLDTDAPRAQAIEALFRVKLRDRKSVV